MKKSTLLGCFMCLLTVAMNAQFTQPSASETGSRNSNVEKQQKPNTSVEELVARYNNIGAQSGSVSQFFTPKEQRVLNSYFNTKNIASKGPHAQLLAESFDDITTMPAAGYSFVNVSDVVGTTNWFQGNSAVFPSHEGAPTSYIGANFNNTAGSIINNFMITPVLNLENGDEITFWTRTTTASTFPDRLEVRISPDGSNVDPSGPASVGSYTELLLEINPTLVTGVYPDVWTQFTVTVAGLTGATDTRVAFRYFVTDGGPSGNNSDYIGIDSLSIDEGSGGGTFPGPYCGPLDFTSNVEPITLVDVAGISNVTDAAVNGTPDHEDFTTISGDMEAGMSYPIALEGNTDGNFTNRFVVFIDWNHNDILDDAGEVYEMTELLVNSTGIDGQQVTGTIDVPSDALPGTTRMRVKKQFGVTAFLDPCTATSFGQAEDYSINVAVPAVLDTAYGVNNSNQDLIGFDITDPSTTEVFGTSPVTVNFENAGAIDPANPTTGYVLDNGGQFYSFDVTTGFYTLLGTISGDWVGMEFDQASGTLYAIAGTSLYTIDPAGVSATLVGSLGLAAGDLPIALAIDGAGVGYTYELVSDVLYTVDLTTGAATLVGSIGFDANFGQGMAYDALTDTVYMSAFNNGSFAGEWRSVDTTTGMSTLIGPIVTSEATTQVAWVSIGETLPPPPCPEPTNLTVSNITETTADLAWDAEPNASSGYIWYVFEAGANPTTDTPVATGTTAAGTTTATADGLTNATSYDFYVVADCNADGLSTYAGPITFDTLVTPPSCGGNYYDTGGPGSDYDNNENVTTIITPDLSGDRVMVTFTAFDVEATWDALYVYDGPDATFPIIGSGNPATNSGFPAGGYYGTDNPGPFTSTDPSGALTFVFLSDSSVPRAGWEADVVCFTPPPANDMIVNSIDVDEIGFPYTDPSVAMPAATTEDGSPVGCDLTGANGVWYNFVPEGDGTATASITTPGGASAVTFYTAPNENSVETDLTLVPQNTNQCAPGTSSSINTVAGQAYYVFVLNTGSVTDIVIGGTNLGTVENSIVGFSFYPNPSTNTLNLEAADTIDSVSIYNLLGQRVINNSVEATSSQVDVSALSAGTYIMKVSVNGQIGTYKVLKK